MIVAVRPAHAPLLAVAFGAGCTTTTPTILYTPITGIQIVATDVVAEHGCGTSPGQVYKYAVVVAPHSTEAASAEMALTSGVRSCFADAIFSNLPSPDGASEDFDISIFAFNRASFPAALECSSATAPCPGDSPATLMQWTRSANWTTTCVATQLQGVTTVAQCGMLEASDASLLPEGTNTE